MELIKERISPERDPYNYKVTYKRLDLEVLRCIRTLIPREEGSQWNITVKEVKSSHQFSLIIKDSDLSQRLKMEKWKMDQISKGEFYQFTWKILEQKTKSFYLTNTQRFKLGKRIELFDGYRKINISRKDLSHVKYFSF